MLETDASAIPVPGSAHPPWSPSRWLGVPITRALMAKLAGAFTFRFLCIAAMYWLAVWAEARHAPTLPDTLLSHIPYVGWVDRWNYVAWTLAYAPVALLLFARDVHRFCRYMVASGLVAFARGLCIAATGLGPVRGGPELHVGLNDQEQLSAWAQLATPFGSFLHDPTKPFYLSKDLFFSGHTASTFMLLLYVWRFPRLRVWMAFAHLVVVASVFLSHLHYTIDVIGAYAVTFSLYVLMEGNIRQILGGHAGAPAMK